MSKIGILIRFLSMMGRFHILLLHLIIIAICSSYGYDWYNSHVILTTQEAEAIGEAVQEQQDTIQYLIDRKECINL